MASLEFLKEQSKKHLKKNEVDLTFIKMGKHKYGITEEFVQMYQENENNMIKSFSKEIKGNNTDITKVITKNPKLLDKYKKIMEEQARNILTSLGVDYEEVEEKIGKAMKVQHEQAITTFYVQMVQEFNELMGMSSPSN